MTVLYIFYLCNSLHINLYYILVIIYYYTIRNLKNLPRLSLSHFNKDNDTFYLINNQAVKKKEHVIIKIA